MNQNLKEKIIDETRSSAGFSVFFTFNITESSEQNVAKNCQASQCLRACLKRASLKKISLSTNISCYTSLHPVFYSLRIFKNDALGVAGSAFRETRFLESLSKAEISHFIGTAATEKCFQYKFIWLILTIRIEMPVK